MISYLGSRTSSLYRVVLKVSGAVRKILGLQRNTIIRRKFFNPIAVSLTKGPPKKLFDALSKDTYGTKTTPRSSAAENPTSLPAAFCKLFKGKNQKGHARDLLLIMCGTCISIKFCSRSDFVLALCCCEPPVEF